MCTKCCFVRKKYIFTVFSTGLHKLVMPLTKMEHTTKAVNKIKHFKGFKIILHSRLLTTHLLTVLLCDKEMVIEGNCLLINWNDITYSFHHQKWQRYL